MTNMFLSLMTVIGLINSPDVVEAQQGFGNVAFQFAQPLLFQPQPNDFVPPTYWKRRGWRFVESPAFPNSFPSNAVQTFPTNNLAQTFPSTSFASNVAQSYPQANPFSQQVSAKLNSNVAQQGPLGNQLSSYQGSFQFSQLSADVVVPTDALFPVRPIETAETEAARALLLRTSSYPAVQRIQDMSSEQLRAIQVLHAAHLTRSLIINHRNWHSNNSIGGTRGYGSGTILLGWHAAIIRNFETFVGPNWRLPPGKGVIPQELIIDPKYSASLGQRLTNNPSYTEPSVFQTGQSQILSSETIAGFKTLEDLGEAYGLQNHNGYHFAVGGPMVDSAVSPIDPSFFTWHAQIEREVEYWFTTPNGIAWAQANTNHPYLTGQNWDTVFASPAPFANDGFCGQSGGQGDSMCQWLQGMQRMVNPNYQ